MGQNGRALRLVACAAAGIAGLAGVSGCGAPALTDAATTLHATGQVTVLQPDGSRVAGADGMTLQRGDEVITGARASAVLTTRSRSVRLLPRTAVRIADGAHQSLQRGAAVVDALHGDGETLAVSGYDIDVPAGSATRIDGGVSLRVGSLAGRARVTAPSGATLQVPALFQVMLGGDTVPASTTALHLTDDAAEAAAVPALVRDDELLTDLARGIDGSGSGQVRTVAAAWVSGHASDAQQHRIDGAVHGTAVSNRVLPVVLARSARDGHRAADYRDAVRWRAQGGSWGVIAHLLRVGAASAADSLTALEHAPHGLAHAVAAALVRAAAIRAGQPASGRGGSAAPTATGPGTHSSSTAPGSAGSAPPEASPAPSPPPSQGPAAGLVGKVGDTVRKVLKSLPSPPATITAGLGPVHVRLG